MKKKWTQHIIAVVALVGFVALGMASATMTPEEKAARDAEQAARLTDGKGGIIIVRHNGSSDVAYEFLRLNHSGTGGHGTTYMLWKPGDTHRFTVDEDGYYIIRYRSRPPVAGHFAKDATEFNRNKSVYVSNDGTFEVNLP